MCLDVVSERDLKVLLLEQKHQLVQRDQLGQQGVVLYRLQVEFFYFVDFFESLFLHVFELRVFFV